MAFTLALDDIDPDVEKPVEEDSLAVGALVGPV